MNKYFEINNHGHNIRCKMYANDYTNINKIVVFFTGFAGHKDNGVAEKFAGRIMSKYKSTALITFNWPSHGDDVKKKIALSDSIEYVDLVIDYIKNVLNVQNIYAYATSFGGYMVLRYISEYGNPFVKIALRCPAVNMYEVITNSIMRNDQLDMISKGKSAMVGFDRKIEVSPQFLEDLKREDIRNIDYIDFADDILIMHGTKDEVVPFEAANKFSEDNVIEFITIENADHRFRDASLMEIATKAIINFFEL